MGAFIVGLLIGLAVAAVVYWRLKTKLDRKRQEVQQLRQNLEEQERAYELRLKQTVQSLQADYQQQLAQKTEQKTEAVQQQYEARIQELETARELAIQAIPTPPEATEAAASDLAASDLAAAEAEVAAAAAEPELAPSISVPPVTATETPTATEAPTIAQPISQDNVPTRQPDNTIAPDNAIAPSAIATNVAVPAQQQVLESIAPWGRIGGVGSLPVLLGYAGHADSHVRRQVAVELGQVIATYGNRVETQRCIPTLARLSQDSNASVRQAAVQSLGKVPSVKVLPYLKRALRDSNLEVVRIASTAIARFKLYGRQEANLTSGSKKSPLTQRKPTYS